MKNRKDITLSFGERIARDAGELLAKGTAACLVKVVKAIGSTPRNAGAVMLVTEDGFSGTIGGGQLEWICLERARDLIASDQRSIQHSIPLGPEIGQCCGGKVELSFERLDEESLQSLQNISEEQMPEIQIHGAGHTGRALMCALELLPVKATLIDSRANVSGVQGAGPDLDIKHSALPETLVRSAAPQTGFVVLTHSHDLDFLISAEALARGDAAYVGMIGSKTKRAVFCSWLEENGYDPDLAKRLVCPIGGSAVKDKRPEVIAALVAAELLAIFFG